MRPGDKTSLDPNFAGFLANGVTWLKKSSAAPLQGFVNDDEHVPEANRRSAQQKCTHLELMLGQIANFCPVISRNSIVKNSTSIGSIWQTIRLHYGFQSNGAHFLDFSSIELEPDERPKDLYQGLIAFIENNLLIATGSVTHHGEVMTRDKEMSPTLENMVILTWLRLIHSDLPSLVKQRYGTELRSRSLASIKSEISQALDSLLEEIHTAADTKILRATASKLRPPATRPQFCLPQPAAPKRSFKSCPLCKQAGRNDRHFLSHCTFLPAEDRAYFAKTRLTSCEDDEPATSDSENTTYSETNEPYPPHPSARIVSRRVCTKQSPHFKAFYRQYPLMLTLDTGAETSMIKASVARAIGAPIVKTTQQALQADGVTPLSVVGETRFDLSRADKSLHLDALVVEDLDVDILAGIPFLTANDISVHPARHQVTIQNSDIVYYDPHDYGNPKAHAVRRTQAYVLRSSTPATVVWPGEYLEVDLSPDLGHDCTVAIEAQFDTQSSKHTQDTHLWPQPHLVKAVANKIRIVNDSDQPHAVRRNEHFCQARATTTPNLTTEKKGLPVYPHPNDRTTPGRIVSVLTQTTCCLRQSKTSSTRCFVDLMTCLTPRLLAKMVQLAPSKQLSTWAQLNHPREKTVYPNIPVTSLSNHKLSLMS